MIKINKSKTFKLLKYGLIAVCFVLLTILGSIRISTAIELSGLKDGDIIIAVKDNQMIDLKAKKAKRIDILKTLSEKTDTEIKVEDGAADQIISIALKDMSLQDAIKKIVGNNYVLALKKTDNGFEVIKGNIVSVKDRIKEFIGSFAIDGPRIKMFFMPEGSSPESIAEYIKERHKLLDYLAEKYPNKVIETQISLKDFLTMDEITAMVNQYDVRVKTINDGWKDNSGGFDLPEGQSFEEAVPELIKYNEEFFKSMMEDKDETSEESNSKMGEYYRNFKEKGVMVYGLKIEGKVKELKNIKDSISQVRIMDPLWKGNLFNLLEKTHIVAPIAIPLNPFSEPVSELEQ